MSRLSTFREYGHPLLLIAVWAALQAGNFVWVALISGDPSYGAHGGSLGSAILLTALLAVFLALGSRIAWWIAIFFHTLWAIAGVGFALFGSGPATKGLGITIFSAGSLWLMWSGNVELHVQAKTRRRLPSDAPSGV